MGQKENERLLSADMDHKIVGRFLKQAKDRGFTKKRALAAAVKLWMELSLENQARLLSQDVDPDSLPTLFDTIDEQSKKTASNWVDTVDKQIKKTAASINRKK
jgi:hypothetical protein